MTLLMTIGLVGLLIALHEFGHFIAARVVGVKVLRFSVGFGPALLARRVGETEYQLSAIPIGGYVHLLNEPVEGPLQGDADLGRSLAEQKPSRRALIFAAGPLMNLLLPFLLLPLVFMIGLEVPAYLQEPPVIGHVASGSTADRAGVRVGDKILELDGEGVADWETLERSIAEHASETVRLQVQRGSETMALDVDYQAGLHGLGLAPPVAALLGEVFPGGPAATAGLRDGDRVVEVDGTVTSSWYAFTEKIDRSEGQSLHLVVIREGARVELDVEPVLQDGEYKVGVALAQEMVRERSGIVHATLRGAERSWELIALTGDFVGKLFRGNVDPQQIGGPVAVFRMAGDAVQSSLAETLFVMAFLGIQLGILNLLPIPVLDGGYLLLLLPEMILRRPLPQPVREGLQGVGMMLVLGLMVLAFYNDLSRLF